MSATVMLGGTTRLTASALACPNFRGVSGIPTDHCHLPARTRSRRRSDGTQATDRRFWAAGSCADGPRDRLAQAGMDECAGSSKNLGADWLDCCHFLPFWKVMGLGRQDKQSTPNHHQPAFPVLLAEGHMAAVRANAQESTACLDGTRPRS